MDWVWLAFFWAFSAFLAMVVIVFVAKGLRLLRDWGLLDL